MKFDKVYSKEQDKPILPPDNKKIDLLENVYDYKLYNNLAIYIMKPGIKGNFKTLAPVINNGKVAPSWAIRIYYLDDEWTFHFAAHPNIVIDFNLKEETEKLFEFPLLGHNHVVMVTTKDKVIFENIINSIIQRFQDYQLPMIELQPIDPEYTVDISTTKYHISKNYVIEKFDNETYAKYLNIIQLLIQKNIQEKNEVMRISKRFFKSKVLNKRDLNYINSLTDKYINQREKITVALKYILSSKGN